MNPESAAWHISESSSAFLLAEEAAYWILTKKGSDLVLLDLRGKSDVCDFFLICTGQADAQVRAIAGAVQDGLVQGGHKLLHAEGLAEGRWALLDYVDVVVHIFQPETRGYYLLEKLWGDTPRLEIDEAYFHVPAVQSRHPDLHVIPLPKATADKRDMENP